MTKTNQFGLLVMVLLCAASAFAQAPPVNPNTASQAASQPKAIDVGRLDGVNYTNDFFGLSLSIPKDWLVTTAPKDMEELVKEGEVPPERVRDSFERSTVLLALTKFEAGQPNNASFMLIAERIPRPAIKNGLDVIASMKNAMSGTNFKVEFQGVPMTEQINGTEFGVVTVKNSSPFGAFLQKFYVTVKKGYALQWFLTYTDAADLPTFDAVVKSVKIK